MPGQGTKILNTAHYVQQINKFLVFIKMLVKNASSKVKLDVWNRDIAIVRWLKLRFLEV